MCSLNGHEIIVQYSSMPFNCTEQEATRTLGGHELIEVEQGMKTDPDECCGNREVQRQWTVFPGGILKQFKPEHNDVLKEVKSEHDGHTLKREVARSWVVCPGGVLKEVKTEHNE